MDGIGKTLYSYSIGFVVIVLAVVFALQFGGPQAEGCSGGGAAPLATVYGETISVGDFQAAYTLAGFDRYDRETAERQGLRKMIVDGLVERVLLARAAREAGFATSEDDVMRRFAQKGTAYLSVGVESGQESGELPLPVKNRDGDFDRDGAKRFIQYGLRRSVGEFAQAQVDETLAHRMRETLLSTVQVSQGEVWEAFVRERDTARIEYIRFSPSYYRDRVEPTEDALRAWVASHEEAVDREYQANRHRYTGLDPQVRARHILVRLESGASDDVRAAARTRAEQLLARARAGESFEALAREHSDDTASARRGGDLGYNPRGRMVAAFDEALFALEVDQISDLVETQFGFHMIKAVGKREGDVPEEEAKLELADRLYREDHADALAREAADRALAALRGGTTMEALGVELAGPVTEEGQESEDEPDPLAPSVQETRAFGRGDSPITGSSDNGPLVRAAFELTMESPLPEAPVALGNELFVFRITERNLASRDDFTNEVRDRIRTGLTRARHREAIALYVHRLRQEAQADGAIRVDLATLDAAAEEQEEADEEEGEGAPARPRSAEPESGEG